MRFLGLSAAALFTLTTCAAPQALPPPPPPPPPVNNTVLLPPVVKTPEIVQPTGHWTDWPMEAGAWSYTRDDRGSIARYGVAGRDALVMLRCDRQRARIYFSRAARETGSMMVRTSSVSKAVPVGASSAQPPYVASELAVNDTVLDAMAFSRGRIALELPGTQNIAIPVWSEIGRVVEDCRA
jgi:hypothetical protein